jgi:hypothetical protein
MRNWLIAQRQVILALRVLPVDEQQESIHACVLAEEHPARRRGLEGAVVLAITREFLAPRLTGDRDVGRSAWAPTG